MSCIYKYKGKDYTKDEFYSLVSNPDFIQQEQVKKFAELQERLSNKEFLEGAKNAFESSEELQNVYYEAAEFRSDRDTTVRNSIVQAYKNKTTISLKTSLLEDLLEFDRTKNEKFYTDKELTGVENIKKLKESIKKDGLKEPLELVINSQGAVVLAEGNHRFQALKELGYKEIPVIVKGRGSKDEYFTEVRQGKQVKLGLNLNKDFNAQITPQQKQEVLNAYTDYIARVSLGIIKNPSSGEYNYNSEVKDIVYHGTDTRFESFDKNKISSKESTAHAKGFYFGWAGKFGAAASYAGNFGRGKEKVLLANTVQIQNPFILNGSFAPIKENQQFVDFLIRNGFDITKWKHYPKGDIFDYTTSVGTDKITEALKREGYDSIIVNKGGWKTIKRNVELGDVQANSDELIVFEPEQIHILGSKQDIEGFKEFVDENKNVVEMSIEPVTNPTEPYIEMKLIDGEFYNKYRINAELLLDLGYTPEDAGEILKEICK